MSSKLKDRLKSIPDKNELCPVCSDLPWRDVKQSCQCGHRFCGSCTIDVCPVDKIRIDEFFRDKYYQREVLDKECHCCFRDKGCTWEGVIGGLHKHEGECDYADVACPECRATTSRKNLQVHQRDHCEHRLVSCQYCSQHVKLNQVDDHRLQCPDIPLKCPHGCSATGILRRTLEDHLSSHCPNAIHPCRLADNGCTFRGTQEEQEEHQRQNVDLHLLLMAKSEKQKQDVITSLVNENDKLRQKIERCESAINTLGELTDVVRKMFDAGKLSMQEENNHIMATQIDEVMQSIQCQAAFNKKIQEKCLALDGHESRLAALEKETRSHSGERNNILQRLQRVENASLDVFGFSGESLRWKK